MPPKPKSIERLEQIGSRFESFQRNGRAWKACCPIHDDSDPSLSINLGEGGRIVMCCHAGCRTDHILESVGLRMADLMPGAKRSQILAKYDYTDEDGRLLYQAVRCEPKRFWQRPANGSWSMKGVQKVLYNLPEVKDVDEVWLVEGEKDADRVTAEGLVATTVIGGADGKWLDEYTETLRDKDVILLPDNDAPGWDRVNRIAPQLVGVAKSVKVVELPGLPDKGDVSDWLDAGGTLAELRQLAANTANTTTRQQVLANTPTGANTCGPVGSLAVLAPLEPYPAEALPPSLARFAESIAAALPCPVDYPGVLMLPVLATFIGRRRCIQVKPGWIEYPTLWIASVARSGDRKTPAFDDVKAPLEQKLKQQRAEYLKKKEEYDALSPEEQKEQKRPQLQQIFTTDTTIEALKGVLAANPLGVICPVDEIAGWARAIGQYKGFRGDDRQNWLSIWSSQTIVSNRTGKEPVIIPDPFVSVTGGIQPDVLPELIDDRREDGFSARILFSYPDPIPPADWTEDTIDASEQYAGICEALFDLEPSTTPIPFSAPAKAVWIEWVNAHRRETPPDNLRPAWSKMEGYCARLTLVLFLARRADNQTTDTQIDVPSIEGAVKLIAYFKSHARRVYAHVNEHCDNALIPRVVRWIRKKGRPVKRREVQMNFKRDLRTADDAADLLSTLEEMGYGTVTSGPKGSSVFTLNTDQASEETN